MNIAYIDFSQFLLNFINQLLARNVGKFIGSFDCFFMYAVIQNNLLFKSSKQLLAGNLLKLHKFVYVLKDFFLFIIYLNSYPSYMHFQRINLRYQRLICLSVNKFASKFKWQGALNMEQIFGFCVLCFESAKNLRTCIMIIEVFCELCRNYEPLFL